MEEQQPQQQEQYMPQPAIPQGQFDQGLQRFRTTFDEEVRNLRIALTGKYPGPNRQDVTLWEGGLLCSRHFNKIIPKLFLSNTKATALSKIYEDRAEHYIVDLINSFEGWLLNNAYDCPDCAINRDYNTLSEIAEAIEVFFYMNFYRAVNGHESEMLSTMHQSHEIMNMSQQPERRNWLSSLAGWRRSR